MYCFVFPFLCVPNWQMELYAPSEHLYVFMLLHFMHIVVNIKYSVKNYFVDKKESRGHIIFDIYQENIKHCRREKTTEKINSKQLKLNKYIPAIVFLCLLGKHHPARDPFAEENVVVPKCFF